MRDSRFTEWWLLSCFPAVLMVQRVDVEVAYFQAGWFLSGLLVRFLLCACLCVYVFFIGISWSAFEFDRTMGKEILEILWRPRRSGSRHPGSKSHSDDLEKAYVDESSTADDQLFFATAAWAVFGLIAFILITVLYVALAARVSHRIQTPGVEKGLESSTERNHDSATQVLSGLPGVTKHELPVLSKAMDAHVRSPKRDFSQFDVHSALGVQRTFVTDPMRATRAIRGSFSGPKLYNQEFRHTTEPHGHRELPSAIRRQKFMRGSSAQGGY